MSLLLDSLRSLPEGAEWSQRQGRASATVSRQGDRIIVTAACDSLQLLVMEYSRKLRRQTERIEEQSVAVSHLENTVRTLKEQRLNARRMALWLFVAGMAVGAILTTVITTTIRKIRRIWQK